ncbi:MAG TPA: hypothetical protein VNS22_22300 [Geminicoccus sp.]|uniref:hypothetical protein n=1 Tax=Geminicoccus sp. TaxID=2024832 RepID=UPI002C169860|nr:hypothetical protein [Geminicoccus sp.]HWL71090.1 hypothetical protein [Geminicoccus sp.]
MLDVLKPRWWRSYQRTEGLAVALPTHGADLPVAALLAPAAASPLPDILGDFLGAEGAEIIDLLAFRHTRASSHVPFRPNRSG